MNLKGTKTKDTLVGSTGADYISGKGGADVLVSNGGDDFLKGGKGADTFVFFASPEGSPDVSHILDFKPGQDNIIVMTAGFDSNVSATYDSERGDISVSAAGVDPDAVVNIGVGLYMFPSDLVVA